MADAHPREASATPAAGSQRGMQAALLAMGFAAQHVTAAVAAGLSLSEVKRISKMVKPI